MLNIDDTLKAIYKNDRLPLVKEIAPKELEAYFTDLNLLVDTGKFAVDKGDFELAESICSDGSLKFGKCNASVVKFALADITDDIKGKEFVLTQKVISGEVAYSVPLGIFKVDSATKQDDLRFKNIVAYDRMKRIDVDVSTWYNGLFPTGNETYTLATFRSSFLSFIGIEEDTSNIPLPNDGMTVTKTIEPSKISGRTVIEACEELNGCFGHINRYGKFTHIILNTDFGLFPDEVLFPDNLLYPEIGIEVLQDINYASVKYEEYSVKAIDKLQIRQEETDIGAIVGTGSNSYVIEGNFLVYGKSAEELSVIAANAFVNIINRPYRPYESDNIGLPYIEVGDSIAFRTNDEVAGYVFSRTLTGIQSLIDKYEAPGTEFVEQNFDTNDEILQLNGKLTRIQKTVEGVTVEVEDLNQELTSSMELLAGQVVLKVDAAGNIGLIDLLADPETGMTSIKLKANNMDFEGLVTVNGNFKILEDGTIEATNGKFNGEINAAKIIGPDIFGGNFTSSTWSGNEYGQYFDEININGGNLYCRRTLYTPNGSSFTASTTLNFGGLTTNYIRANSVGAAGNPVASGWFTNIDADYADFDELRVNGTRLNTLYMNNTSALAVLFDTNQSFRPSSGGSTVFNLGSASYPWTTLYTKSINHLSGGSLGFFGATPQAKKSVPQTSASATLANVITDLNAFKTAMAGYGLISS